MNGDGTPQSGAGRMGIGWRIENLVLRKKQDG